MNEFEQTPGFIERYREFYVSRGHLTGEQFDDAKRKADKIQSLRLLPGVYWGVTPQLTSMYPKLLTSVKLQAQAAGFNQPFESLTAYTSRWPAPIVKRTTWPKLPELKTGQKIGSVFRDLGLISTEELVHALGIQQYIRDEVGTTPRIGVLLQRVARVSVVDLLQVVGMQVGIPYENMDQFVTAYEKQFNSSASP